MEIQTEALGAIREFLHSKTSYDVLPVSFKLVMLDTALTLKGSLLTLLQNGIISAPLWDSKRSRFAGLLTASDFVSALQYLTVNQEPEELSSLTLDRLQGVETSIGARPLETLSIHPFNNLSEACDLIIESKAHRIPMVDRDPATQREVVVSVLTQYRVLRFVALNCKETQDLLVPISEIGLGKQDKLYTATMSTPLSEVIEIFSEHGISCVPIVDENHKLLNVYETYDVLTLIKGGGFADLSLTVGEALMRRPQDFEGVMTCAQTDTLAHIMETIRRSRVLRLCVVNEEGTLQGLVTLVDILRYILTG